MPPLKTKSALAAKYGQKLDGAVQKHADEATTYGIINLPGGIENGIARLSKCYFKQFEQSSNMKTASGASAAGEYYFRAEGVIVSPESVGEGASIVPVKGLVTSIMIPVCDTKTSTGKVTTQEENIGHILNRMRQLGGEDYTKGAGVEDLETLAAGLEEAAPYFRFSTRSGKPSPQYPTPRVFEEWHGAKGMEDYQEDRVSAFNEAVEEPAKAVSTKPAPSVNGKKPAAAPEPVEEVEEAAEESLEDLLALAESDADSNTIAQERLIELAIEAGYDDDTARAANTWAEVYEMINNPKTEGEEEAVEEEAEEEAAVPEKGQTCKYTPPGKDPKTKKDYKERECKILMVNPSKETVNLTDLVTKATYKDVAWSALS